MRSFFGMLILLACSAVSSVSFGQSPPKLRPLEQGMKEFENPGSTAVGQPVSVLALWGTPTRTAQLGDVTLYTWVFLAKQTSDPTYSGTVSPSGNVTLSPSSRPPEGCEITVQTNSKGVIESVSKRMLGGSSCTPPAIWWQKH